jgi:hypothetical protein
MMHGTLRALQDAQDASERSHLTEVATQLWLRPPSAAARNT